MATGRTIAWGPWLEQTVDYAVHHACSRVGKAMMEPIQATKPRQGEQEQEQKEEPEDMKGHRILAAGNDEHVEPLKGRVNKAEGIVKPFRREGRIIHYRVGQYPSATIDG